MQFHYQGNKDKKDKTYLVLFGYFRKGYTF